MKTSRVIHSVSCHAEGEVGDVITGGVGPLPGDTIWAQSRHIAEDGELRDFILNEPRGGVFRHVNLLVPAIHPDADLGFIIMEPEHTPPMSGSNAMCVATVVLETGIIPMREPVTELVLEAPGGLVRVHAQCVAGRVEMVHVTNVPSFVGELDAVLEVEGLGSLTVDTAYGGDSFVLIPASSLGLELVPDQALDIARTGMAITRAANEQLRFQHPENPDWAHFSFCQITDPVERGSDGELLGRNAVAIEPGKLDRSPCGTGCSARMAVLHQRGELGIGEGFIGESILGTRFVCELESEAKVGDRPAVVPRLGGRAWITGTHQHTLDPEDPFARGYRLTDTWPRRSRAPGE